MGNGETKPDSHPQIVWIVLGSGAAGGIVSWIYSITIGIPPVLPSAGLAILASMVLGAMAAFVSVFVLAHSDLRAALRVAGFALLSGFAWKPVLDGGLAFMQAQVARDTAREVEQAAENVSVLRAKLNSEAAGNQPEIATQLAAETADLLRMAPRLQDFKLRLRIEEEASLSIEGLVTKGGASPVMFTRALGEIGYAAAAQGMNGVTAQASEGVRDISLAAKKADVTAEALNQLDRFKAPEKNRRITWATFANAEAAAVIALMADSGTLNKNRAKQIRKELNAAAVSSKKSGNKDRAIRLQKLDKDLQAKIAKLPR